MEIPRGRGVEKAKVLKGTYGAQLEFSGGVGEEGGGGGSIKKTFCGGGKDIFWNHTTQLPNINKCGLLTVLSYFMLHVGYKH